MHKGLQHKGLQHSWKQHMVQQQGVLQCRGMLHRVLQQGVLQHWGTGGKDGKKHGNKFEVLRVRVPQHMGALQHRGTEQVRRHRRGNGRRVR